MLKEKIEIFEKRVFDIFSKKFNNNNSILEYNPENPNFYYKEITKKKKIVLHHTVGNLYGDFLALTRQKVSVSYLIDTKGRVINLFPDKFWSYHLGKTALGGNYGQSRVSIGIELSNYGPLIKDGDLLKNVYGQVYCTLSDTKNYTKTEKYRGYEYWTNYTEEQYIALKILLKRICEEHNIPYEFLPKNLRTETTSEVISFSGIVSHVNFRKDKTDVSPIFNYAKIYDEIS